LKDSFARLTKRFQSVNSVQDGLESANKKLKTWLKHVMFKRYEPKLHRITWTVPNTIIRVVYICYLSDLPGGIQEREDARGNEILRQLEPFTKSNYAQQSFQGPPVTLLTTNADAIPLPVVRNAAGPYTAVNPAIIREADAYKRIKAKRSKPSNARPRICNTCFNTDCAGSARSELCEYIAHSSRRSHNT
jgi:hypothetical protein